MRLVHLGIASDLTTNDEELAPSAYLPAPKIFQLPTFVQIERLLKKAGVCLRAPRIRHTPTSVVLRYTLSRRLAEEIVKAVATKRVSVVVVSFMMYFPC